MDPMPYDERLAERLDRLIKRRKGFVQKKMFGGIGFLLNGHMCFGVYEDCLILRLGEEAAQKALASKHTRAFDITGHAMKGWVMVEAPGTRSSTAVKAWIDGAIRFVKTLPTKD